MRELRTETRNTLAEHSHRLNVIEAAIASLNSVVAVLLSSPNCRSPFKSLTSPKAMVCLVIPTLTTETI